MVVPVRLVRGSQQVHFAFWVWTLLSPTTTVGMFQRCRLWAHTRCVIALLLHAVHPYHLTAISQSALARGVVLISCLSGTYSVVALRCSLVYTRPSLLLGGALFGLCVGDFPPRAWLLGALDAKTGSSGAFLHFNCPFYPTDVDFNVRWKSLFS